MQLRHQVKGYFHIQGNYSFLKHSTTILLQEQQKDTHIYRHQGILETT